MRTSPWLLASLLTSLLACDPPPEEDDLGLDGGARADGGVLSDGGASSDAGAGAVISFTDTFKQESWGSCASADHPVLGYAPATPGLKHPLFIYTVGTWDTYSNPVVHAILREAASRGFVAVSPEYNDNFLFSCDDLANKSKCLYDPQEPASVASRICGRPDVDCALGIVTAGHSQGAQLALSAKNFNSRVRGAYGLGATCDFVGSFGAGDSPGLCDPNNSANACLLKASLAIPADRLRLVDGQDEVCYSTSTSCAVPASQGELERISGATCATEAMSCLSASGSGWLIVPNSAVSDGSAHHTWFGKSDGGLDRAFAPPATDPWSLDTNLDWLAALTGGTPTPLRINAGATSTVNGSFSKDDYYVGATSLTLASAAAIDVSALDAAPAAVYQSQRWSFGRTLSYRMAGLAPDTTYTLRLHFAELYWSSPGRRRFNVDVQGARQETDLDVVAQAGAANKALVKSYRVASDGAGVISVDFTPGSIDNPIVNGIEVLAITAGP